MNTSRRSRRKAWDFLLRYLTVAAVVIAMVPLVSILVYITVRGAAALNWDFFTQLPKPVGEPGGGMANAMAGSLILLGLSCLVGIPLGLAAGIYLAEFGKGWLAGAIRFTCEVLTGVPTMVTGIFIYAVMVRPMQGYSAWAGGLALGLIMLPLVTRVTEDMLRLVPVSLREASLALGASRWRTTVSVVLKSGLGGIVTGVMLALARVAGETAPLLYTALGSRNWPTGLDQPTASLTVAIYNYAISPYPDWQSQAWGAALVLLAVVLVINVLARFASRNRYLGR